MNASSRRDLWTRYIASGNMAPIASSHCNRLCAVHKDTLGMKTVLGIDPSLRGTGLAIVEKDEVNGFTLKYFDVIDLHSVKRNMSDCLCAIFEHLQKAIDDHRPGGIALEQAIYVQNVKTAQIMGAVKGVVLTAVKLKKLEVKEYPPLRVKQSISGYGRATKEQIARMVKVLLKLPENLPYDASDAAAVALCHFFTSSRSMAVLCH